MSERLERSHTDAKQSRMPSTVLFVLRNEALLFIRNSCAICQ